MLFSEAISPISKEPVVQRTKYSNVFSFFYPIRWNQTNDSIEVLLQLREGPNRDGVGYYSSIGGKTKPGEELFWGSGRELFEELLIHLEGRESVSMQTFFRGIIDWTNDSQGRCLGLIFSGYLKGSRKMEFPLRTEEGVLSWVPIHDAIEGQKIQVLPLQRFVLRRLDTQRFGDHRDISNELTKW